MSRISIIIVSYNEKEYLNECLNSCMLQKEYNDIEIIIGDDGSDDGSIDYIKDICSKNNGIIKYFVMDRNEEYYVPSLRVSNVIKRALSMTTGDYCLILSGDDKLLGNTFLSKAKEFLDLNKDYSCVLSNSFVRFWDDGKTVNSGIPMVTPSEYWKGCFMEDIMFGYRQRSGSIMHEADELELCLFELMLFQDCLNKGWEKKATYSRFYKPFKYVKEHRMELNNPKYEKYFKSSYLYKNNVIGYLKDYTRINYVNYLFNNCEKNYTNLILNTNKKINLIAS